MSAARLLGIALAGALVEPSPADEVVVFILAGQSNMEGKGTVRLLESQLEDRERHAEIAHLRTNGAWLERDDVYIKFLDRKGRLTVGFGSPGRIGPELQFGIEVGDHYSEPVLLIKTAWGGKSLFRDFRPPSAGLPSAEVLNHELEQERKRHPEMTLEKVRERYGHYYRLMISEVKNVLTNLEREFPELKGRRPRIEGFVWFQGWNDMINDAYTAEYTDNMRHLIRDVRRDLQQPALPVVIGVMGVGGDREVNPKHQRFRDAQVAAADSREFKGTVRAVKTASFWDWEADAVFKKGWRDHLDEWKKVGDDYPYHYLGSVKCYGRMGGAFARAMIELTRADAAPPTGSRR